MICEYGAPDAPVILIRPVAEQDPDAAPCAMDAIRQLTERRFLLAAVTVGRWEHDLSPWEAPAVFQGERFGGGAAALLDEIARYCREKSRPCCIGGYSLAALFSLWAACETDLFAGVAAASPSIWFPGFIDYLSEHRIRSRAVYLSLGD